MEIQSITKLRILLAIREAPKSGYDLMRLLDTGKKRPSPSQIYPFLSVLRREGLVLAGKAEAREKTRYSLTPKGRKLVLRLSEKLGAIVEFSLKEKMKICYHCGAEVYSGEFKMGKNYFCCPHCADDYREKGGVCERCK